MSKGALEFFRERLISYKQWRLGRDFRALIVFSGGDSYEHDKGPTFGHWIWSDGWLQQRGMI